MSNADLDSAIIITAARFYALHRDEDTLRACIEDAIDHLILTFTNLAMTHTLASLYRYIQREGAIEGLVEDFESALGL